MIVLEQEQRVRLISICYPSGCVKLTLWEGTDEEESFPVKCLRRGRPYVFAYGCKYYLTDKEVNFIRNVLGF